ncbi:MAG: response regulator [Proteobacteria bacterium]|nr:response regulator [Pseudomonadota bacterium]
MLTFDAEDTEIIMSLARELTGTKVNSTHHSIIVQNVATRMTEVGCQNLEEYLVVVDANDEEMPYLLSAVTIHTTGWFRERGAFERLEKILSERFQNTSEKSVFRVLSVACSTGEEVYSIAAVLQNFRRTHANFSFEIEGCDIDPISLRTARHGVYDANQIDGVESRFSSYFSQIGDMSGGEFAIRPSIRANVRFKTVNILQPPIEAEKYDFVICRNMLIYFEAADVTKIVEHLLDRVAPFGHFCTGVSETSALSGSHFVSVGQATYAIKGLVGGQNRRVMAVEATVKSVKVGARRILVVDDDDSFKSLMVEYLSTEGFDVLAASCAEEAMGLLEKGGIGLVLSDFRMPGKNGLELCKAAHGIGYKGAFVVISGLADSRMAEDGLQIGCSEVILKPVSSFDLIRVAKAYVGEAVKVSVGGHPDLVLFGASTGGTEVLVRLLKNLPPSSPAVFIVQHITAVFAREFAERLSRSSGLPLGQMKHDAIVEKGHLYAALGDYHIGVKNVGGQLRLIVSDVPAISSHRPSVDFLFDSAALCRRQIFAGLLTGMGRDGANGLLKLRQSGAQTFAQNEATCTVYGMPKEAVKLNAAVYICSPEDIRKRLDERLKQEQSGPRIKVAQ